MVQIGKRVMEDINIWHKGARKKSRSFRGFFPPGGSTPILSSCIDKELLIWKFLGDRNILVSNGEDWKKYSRIVKGALERTLPMEEFVNIGKRMLTSLGDGGAQYPFG
jgi:hypothetical protein